MSMQYATKAGLGMAAKLKFNLSLHAVTMVPQTLNQMLRCPAAPPASVWRLAEQAVPGQGGRLHVCRGWQQ